nr:MAG TPA: hypothetical protein [Caudoviricetes sp.]
MRTIEYVRVRNSFHNGFKDFCFGDILIASSRDDFSTLRSFFYHKVII